MDFPLKNYSKLLPKTLLLLGLISSSALAVDSEEELGELLYKDANLSLTRITSCATCHSLDNPGLLGLRGTSPSFVDDFAMAINFPVSLGAKLFATPGTLNAPSAGYAAFTPEFHVDADGNYVGGQFWNGRASSLADQAEGPFLNQVEMMMPSKWALVTRLKEKQSYVKAFRDIYNIDLDDIPGNANASASLTAPPGVTEAYRAVAVAIGEFEKTNLFNRFTSKYDFYLAGKARLSSSEKRGLNLFNGRGGCSGCHTSEESTGPYPLPPLFTNHKFYNIGVPRNVKIPNNPTPDIGLAGNPEVIADGLTASELGKHRVVSLRNVANTPPYMHNGVLSTLKQVVHFHNTRDTLWQYGTNKTFGFGVWVWPKPEYSENVTNQVGNLGLSNRDENDIVNFLRTLSDGYFWQTTSPWSDNARPAIDLLHSSN